MRLALSAIAAVSLAALAGCEGVIPISAPATVEVPPVEPAPQTTVTGRIATEAGFQTAVVGKRLVAGGDSLLIEPTGRMTGVFGGRAVQGFWQFTGGSFCRTLVDYEGPAPLQQCQIVLVDRPGTVTFVAPSGQSGTFLVAGAGGAIVPVAPASTM